MKRPLAFVGFGFLAVQLLAALVPQAALWLLAAFLICAASVWRRKKRTHLWPAGLAAAAICCALLLRAGYLARSVQPLLRYTEPSAEGCTWTAVMTDTSAGLYEGSVRAVLRVTQENGAAVPRAFLVQASEFPVQEVGDVVHFCAVLSAVEQNRYADSAYAKGIFLQADEVYGVEKVGDSRSPVLIGKRLQKELGQRVRGFLPGENGAIAAAMSVGDKDGLTSGIRSAFRAGGFSHALVVSGLHLGIVSGACFALLRKRLGRRAAAMCALAATVAFIFIAGATPSLLRAGFAAALLYLGMLFDRASDALTSLGFSALVLCAWNPFAALDFGLLLSYSATLGVLFAVWLSQRLFARVNAAQREHTLLRSLHSAEQKQSLRSKVRAMCFGETAAASLLRGVASALLISLCTMIFTLPVLAAMGASVSLLGVFCNFLAVPCVTLVVMSGLILALCSGVGFLYLPAQLAGLFCGTGTRFLYALGRWAEGFPEIRIALSGPVAVCALLGAALLLYAGYRMRMPLIYNVAATVLLLAVTGALYAALDASVVRIAAVGGSGNPAVVVTQNDNTAVLFRGADGNLDAVQDYLAQNNRRRVDVLIDLRHTEAGAADLAQQLQARTCVDVSEEVRHARRVTLWENTEVVLRRQVGGNYAFLNAAGYTMGMSSGKVDLAGYDAPQVYLAGTVQPLHLECALLLAGQKKPDWIFEARGARQLAWATGNLRLVVRPNRAMKLEGAAYDSA